MKSSMSILAERWSAPPAASRSATARFTSAPTSVSIASPPPRRRRRRRGRAPRALSGCRRRSRWAILGATCARSLEDRGGGGASSPAKTARERLVRGCAAADEAVPLVRVRRRRRLSGVDPPTDSFVAATAAGLSTVEEGRDRCAEGSSVGASSVAARPPGAARRGRWHARSASSERPLPPTRASRGIARRRRRRRAPRAPRRRAPRPPTRAWRAQRGGHRSAERRFRCTARELGTRARARSHGDRAVERRRLRGSRGSPASSSRGLVWRATRWAARRATTAIFDAGDGAPIVRRDRARPVARARAASDGRPETPELAAAILDRRPTRRRHFP